MNIAWLETIAAIFTTMFRTLLAVLLLSATSAGVSHLRGLQYTAEAEAHTEYHPAAAAPAYHPVPMNQGTPMDRGSTGNGLPWTVFIGPTLFFVTILCGVGGFLCALHRASVLGLIAGTAVAQNTTARAGDDLDAYDSEW